MTTLMVVAVAVTEKEYYTLPPLSFLLINADSQGEKFHDTYSWKKYVQDLYLVLAS